VRLVDPRPRPAANELARHRIHPLAHPDRRVVVHPHHRLRVVRQLGCQVLTHRGHLLREPLAPQPVGSFQNPDHKAVIRLFALEIPAAAQQQMLLQPSFEMPVHRLAGPVLVRAAHVGRALAHPEVLANRKELLVEPPPLPVTGKPVRCRRGIIDKQLLGNAAQPSDGRFETGTNRQQRLAATPHRPLPVRIRQHRMEHQAVELHPADAHPEIPHA